ncbi:hypothetical protein PVAP13_7KG119165 [Panicum virgatum]|uniref:Uncharacterized protein n=1 Tax=Panicum virgatum TaxID=38727 RepID=A0A8T0Q9R1_PANVG|nr:hypothetical protein PVAP13_7KG119165 [Panicum virgatum]
MERAAAAGWSEKPLDQHEGARGAADALYVVAVGLVTVGLGGAALLMWWALAFLPAHEQLWMVPAGLVLLGIPILAWLSLTSGSPARHARVAPPCAAHWR